MQSTIINDLDFSARYEIKTVGRNTMGTSPESNITEASVAGNPVVGKPLKTSFITNFSLRKQPSFFAPGPSGISREGRRASLNRSLLAF